MRDLQLYLMDILMAMGAIQTFVERMDFEAFVADDKTASAVVWKLEIIGEAVNLDILPHLPINWKNRRSPAIIFEIGGNRWQSKKNLKA